ncbi:MAG: 4Fe-4S binding protein [Christensenellaceae bacterium]|jgi:polyferredoxin|nr:4Fe-4S binding protein [Christensenellaceae bacterium]
MKGKLRPVFALALFAAIGLALWRATGKLFYLMNFGYIGVFLSLGLLLMIRKSQYARRVVQLGVGLYMLAWLGLFGRENMQLEGFWYYLFSGLFQAAVIHYLVAKIAGPFLFGRGWCGWACWTAAVLDFLPYKIPRNPRKPGLGAARYAMFALSLGFVLALFLLGAHDLEGIMWLSFIIGNALYYAVGIAMAFALKDNRAFCKYICPITVFLKPMSYFSLVRFKAKPDRCVHCGKCERVCPMNVEASNPARSRRNATECILCGECAKACPTKAFS